MAAWEQALVAAAEQVVTTREQAEARVERMQEALAEAHTALAEARQRLTTLEEDRTHVRADLERKLSEAEARVESPWAWWLESVSGELACLSEVREQLQTAEAALASERRRSGDLQAQVASLHERDAERELRLREVEEDFVRLAEEREDLRQREAEAQEALIEARAQTEALSKVRVDQVQTLEREKREVEQQRSEAVEALRHEANVAQARAAAAELAHADLAARMDAAQQAARATQDQLAVADDERRAAEARLLEVDAARAQFAAALTDARGNLDEQTQTVRDLETELSAARTDGSEIARLRQDSERQQARIHELETELAERTLQAERSEPAELSVLRSELATHGELLARQLGRLGELEDLLCQRKGAAVAPESDTISQITARVAEAPVPGVPSDAPASVEDPSESPRSQRSQEVDRASLAADERPTVSPPDVGLHYQHVALGRAPEADTDDFSASPQEQQQDQPQDEPQDHKPDQKPAQAPAEAADDRGRSKASTYSVNDVLEERVFGKSR